MGKDADAYLSALVTRELIPDYANVIREHVEKREATPRAYVLQFDQLVKYLHKRHRRDLRALGCGSISQFADRIYEVFERELSRLLDRIENQIDTYAFFENQEEWVFNKKCDIKDHKLLWQSNINNYSDCLINSARWKSGLADAAACSAQESNFSRPIGCDEVRRRLPGLAYEDLVSKTGPGHPRRDGQPRGLRHILSPRRLSERLRRDDMDPSRIHVEGAPGEALRSRRVHSRDPQTLEAIADSVGAETDTRYNCLLTKVIALANLSEEAGDLFKMHLDGYRQEDIAAEQGLSQATVSRRLRSILGRIKKNTGKINIC